MRLFKQRKPVLLHLRQMFRLKDNEETPVFIAAIDAVNAFYHVGNQPLHLGERARPVELNIRGKLFVIIDVNQSNVGHLLLEEALVMRRLRAVEPILKQHCALILLAVDGDAHHLVGVAGVLNGRSNKRGSKVKIRLNAANVRLAIDLLHALVAPDDPPAALHERAGNRNLVDETFGEFGILGKDIVVLPLLLLCPAQLRRAANEHQQDGYNEGNSPREHAALRKQIGKRNSATEQSKQNRNGNKASLCLFHTVLPL